MVKQYKGYLLALLCVALWGLIPVMSTLGQTSMDNYQFLFWTMLTSFTFMLLICVITGNLKALKSYRLKDWWTAVSLGMLGTWVYYFLLYRGYKYGKGMEVLIVQYTWPIFISLLAIPFLKEKFGMRKAGAMVLGFSAVCLVLSKGDILSFSVEDPSVLLWIVLGSFCFALFSVISKRIHLEPMSLSMLYFLVATVAAFFPMMMYSDFVLPDQPTLAPLLVNGCFVNGFSYVLWLWALREVEASKLAPLTFMTPLVSTFYMLVFLDEEFLPVYALALMLILIAGYLTLKEKPVQQTTELVVD